MRCTAVTAGKEGRRCVLAEGHSGPHEESVIPDAPVSPVEPKIIAIDFDGVCVAAAFTGIGRNIGAESVLRELTDAGHRLILHTVRTDMKQSCQDCKNSACCVCDEENKVAGQQYLTEAIDWFKGNNIPLWAVNSNPDFLAQGRPSGSKPYADIYLDDQALSFPLIWIPGGERPHADWITIRRKLVELGYLSR